MKNSEAISIRGSKECRFSSELIPDSSMPRLNNNIDE